MIGAKKGKLYLRFIMAIAVIAATLYAYSAFAAVPSAVPVIANTNGTTVNGTFMANANVASASYPVKTGDL